MKNRRYARRTDEPLMLAELLATVFVDGKTKRLDFTIGGELVAVPKDKVVHIAVEYAEERRCAGEVK